MFNCKLDKNAVNLPYLLQQQNLTNVDLHQYSFQNRFLWLTFLFNLRIKRERDERLRSRCGRN